jgi:hypothetical protein
MDGGVEDGKKPSVKEAFSMGRILAESHREGRKL